MAGLCLKGHFSLAVSSPADRQGRLYGSSRLSCSKPVIMAKTGPKLETRRNKQTNRANNTFAEKNIKISLLPDTANEQRKASDNATKKSKQTVISHDEHEELHQAETLAIDDEKADSLTAVVDAAVDGEAPDHEEEGDCQDCDDEESDEAELDELFTEMFVPPGAIVSSDKPLPKLPGSNIYLVPHGKSTKIKEAAFVKSSTSNAECPSQKLPEFAMVGRSNVGKSSLINSLVQRKDLAQTSKKPGKTRLINHFIINQSWYLVDLPGYGYAKVPVDIRASWERFTKKFFLQSKTLVCVMLLVDASIPPQQIDLEYADWLYQKKVPMTIVFTKCDRKKKKKNGGRKPVENIKDFLKLLKGKFDESPPWIMTSCVTNQGKEGLLMHMAQLRNYWNT